MVSHCAYLLFTIYSFGCFLVVSSSSLWRSSLRPLKLQTIATPQTSCKWKGRKTTKKFLTSSDTIDGLKLVDIEKVISDFSRRTLSATIPGGGTYTHQHGFAKITVPRTFIGYRNLALKMKTGVPSDDSMLQYCRWESVSGEQQLQLTCTVDYGDPNIVIRTELIGTSVPDTDLSTVLDIIHGVFSTEVMRELRRIVARRKQEATRQELSVRATKVAKAKELDKIINPEKYRSTSPTVRRARSGSGGDSSGGRSGRYTPSASTQARRQVRRG